MSLVGFQDEHLVIGDASYYVARGGAGPPVLLLHGFPQTHVCRQQIARGLAGAS